MCEVEEQPNKQKVFKIDLEQVNLLKLLDRKPYQAHSING